MGHITRSFSIFHIPYVCVSVCVCVSLSEDKYLSHIDAYQNEWNNAVSYANVHQRSSTYIAFNVESNLKFLAEVDLWSISKIGSSAFVFKLMGGWCDRQ